MQCLQWRENKNTDKVQKALECRVRPSAALALSSSKFTVVDGVVAFATAAENPCCRVRQ